MAVDKPTKYCELTMTLLNGSRVSGRFHVEARTTSAVRPSDAIRESKDSFLVLTDAKCSDADTSEESKTLMVPVPAIAYIELPSPRWITPPLAPLTTAGAAGP